MLLSGNDTALSGGGPGDQRRRPAHGVRPGGLGADRRRRPARRRSIVMRSAAGDAGRGRARSRGRPEPGRSRAAIDQSFFTNGSIDLAGRALRRLRLLGAVAVDRARAATSTCATRCSARPRSSRAPTPRPAPPATPGTFATPKSVSDDGTRVAFYSNARNLVPGDDNGPHDLSCATSPPARRRASAARPTARYPGGDYDSRAILSGDGRYIAFDVRGRPAARRHRQRRRRLPPGPHDRRDQARQPRRGRRSAGAERRPERSDRRRRLARRVRHRLRPRAARAATSTRTVTSTCAT